MPTLGELGLHQPALFALAVLVLNATPGVDLLYTVSRTLAGGWRQGLAAALGVGAGCVVHALLAAFGLAALLAVSAWAFTGLKWAGAAYLVWLGLGMLRQAARPAPVAAATDTPAVARTGVQVFRQGLLTNVLNPKVALFFLAFLPQFIAPQAPHKTLSFLLLGAWFVLQGTLFLAAVVWLTQRLHRAVGGSARLGRGLNAAGGLLFLGLALRLSRAEVPA
ncbi:LysE family translocator [Ideonella oryzae]|uniref:LysE family translocator n=1 Tax=Ideonella oryzae TaxID=2937441 RepID=A0ABT1BPC6_9BURK|nr:LysE family translocator [Ideonella oryzae]MCO5977437.1 LysE family translocator [Ideonella oryzae]